MNTDHHLVNFQHQGAWYELDGKGLYLAHRYPSQIDRKRNAWYLERIALEETVEKGFVGAGVAVKKGKSVEFYVTRASDFFGEHSFVNPKNILQRGLPANRFLITPSKYVENIEKSVRIR